jgi:ferredoxin
MMKVNTEKCGHCGAFVAICSTSSIELIEPCLRIRDACTTCATKQGLLKSDLSPDRIVN